MSLDCQGCYSINSPKDQYSLYPLIYRFGGSSDKKTYCVASCQEVPYTKDIQSTGGGTQASCATLQDDSSKCYRSIDSKCYECRYDQRNFGSLSSSYRSSINTSPTGLSCQAKVVSNSQCDFPAIYVSPVSCTSTPECTGVFTSLDSVFTTVSLLTIVFKIIKYF